MHGPKPRTCARLSALSSLRSDIEVTGGCEEQGREGGYLTKLGAVLGVPLPLMARAAICQGR